MIEATDEADTGDIWLKSSIRLKGTELCDEWRALQGRKTIEMCLQFVSEYPHLSRKKQVGRASFYVRRRPIDSRLDPDKTLTEQFNILRAVDNMRYPAYFEINKQRFVIRVYSVDDND